MGAQPPTRGQPRVYPAMSGHSNGVRALTATSEGGDKWITRHTRRPAWHRTRTRSTRSRPSSPDCRPSSTVCPTTSGTPRRSSSRSTRAFRTGRVFELAGHFDISIGLTRMLIAERAGRPARPRPGQLLHLPALRGRAGRLRLRLHDGRGQDAGPDAGRPARDVRQDDRGVPGDRRRTRSAPATTR